MSTVRTILRGAAQQFVLPELLIRGAEDVLDTAFHVAPGDDRPLPFSQGQRVCVAKGPFGGGALAACCVPEGAPGGPAGTAFAPWSAAWADAPGAGCGCGPGGVRSPEYVEAFDRLDLLASLADGCGDEARQAVEVSKRALAAFFNAGVYALDGGGFDCDPDKAKQERPTVGQVRAALAAFAATVARLCGRSRDAALLSQNAAAPLSVKASGDTNALAWALAGLALLAAAFLFVHRRAVA